MKKAHFLLLIVFALIAFYLTDSIQCSSTQELPLGDSVLTPSTDDSVSVKLALTGDIMGHDPIVQSAYDKSKNTYHYAPIFRYVAPYFRSCHLVIGNLEVTLGGPPYKGYPLFSSPDQLAADLKASGYNFLLTANNHAYDRGKKGMERTLHILDSLQIMHTGTFRDTAERQRAYPFIWEYRGLRLAILNYTYDTNGIRVFSPNVVNLIDTFQIRTDIQKAHHMKADFILVTFHWGEQYQRQENLQQRQLAQFCVDLGADAIVGTHPHVVQPVEYFSPSSDTTKKVPIFFSLGNFLSNQRTRYRDGGIIAELTLLKKFNRTVITKIGYHLTWVHCKQTPKTSYTIIPVQLFEALPKTFDLTSLDSVKLMQYATDTRHYLRNLPELKWDFR
ncbi:MAG: CapA family protein [Bernardetiaceae bacterium]|nr:CapA family protein [Bernardetiaceae bacterium]